MLSSVYSQSMHSWMGSAGWGTGAFRTFASQAYCEQPKSDPSASVASFYDHFNPKYDVPKPMLKPWYSIDPLAMPPSGLTGIALKRIVLEMYMDISMTALQHLDDQEQAAQQDEDAPEWDWGALGNTLKKRLPLSLMGAVREWVVDGIRRVYSMYVYNHWRRKTVWKCLKGPPQSALRKLAKSGVSDLGRVAYTFLRGDMLWHAAECTMRLVLLPYNLWTSLSDANRPLQSKADLVRRSALCEVATVSTRAVLSCAANTGFITLGYYGLYAFGYDTSVPQFAQREEGADRAIGITLTLCVMAANLAADLTSNILRHLLDVYFDLVEGGDDGGDSSDSVEPLPFTEPET